ncbi:hypothetical protein IGI04_039787 [Brassica rapa subsp. trilocularis]|uniref:Uncharacterized protein n=1 Tax=Brassica rapa subsp. trilocularis TaxID=1813537 RepID=A0ABQ7KNW8_BRACM|nr:hypothetical protein IGI04_039787 [Brassica rapa subsp. trilocularis]
MILKYGGVLTHAGDTQGLKIQTFSFHSLKYYSQISPLILLRYYDDAACVLRKMCFDAKASHLSSTLPSTLPWKYYMLLDESTLPATFIDSATHFTLEVL